MIEIGISNHMVDDCLKMNLPESEYRYTFGAVQVVLSKTTPKTTREKLIELIKEDKSITREELAEQLGITINGVKQHILKLKKENILNRLGGRKDGYWKVIDE